MNQFIPKLNARRDGYQYRLPTEAEWEYAARAGTTGDYGGTGTLDEMGWYGSNASMTHPVALKKPNAWGLYDMHGNVSEWVEDWYGRYTAGAALDPRGPTGGVAHVNRGGCWGGTASIARSASRSTCLSGHRGGLGFRLVRVQ